MIHKIQLALACILVCALPLLAYSAGGNAWPSDEILSIRLQPLPDDGAILSVQLAASANLHLYYDSQPPQNENILETYWFRERSDTRSETHTFQLGEIETGRTFYFRLVTTWPSEKWSEPMRWMIPAGSAETIVIK